VCALFLDLAKAFGSDTVNHLFFKLEQIEAGGSNNQCCN